ncbi:MAG: Gfo/Idh/MocA family oxidoreductase, partial [Chitinophagaceae bacterium]
IYIATPPDSHERYALAAIAAGKPVYVEKPMALTYDAAKRIQQQAEERQVKLVVAHYRRMQPFFRKIKELMEEGIIGDIEKVQLVFDRMPLPVTTLNNPQQAWRVDPSISGGGLFHDMAPHQLGLMLYFFGEVDHATGTAINTNELYDAADKVEGKINFANGIRFNGSWNFNAAKEADSCLISGSKGTLQFPVFGAHELEITTATDKRLLTFEIPLHVQQPMIDATVQYFLNKAENPCPAEEGCEVMRLIELFTQNS